MIIKNCRCDWVFLTEANQHGGYSICILIPKLDPQLKAVQEAVEAAKAKGIETGKFTLANTKSANFKNTLHDGDLDFEADERPALYKGHMYVNANNKTQPGLVDETGNPLMDASKMYSGAVYHVDVSFYPFNNKSKGIGCGVNNVMFVKDGERLDGRQSAEEAFAGLIPEGDLD